MPNPSMRDARNPAPPSPTFTTDQNGNRIGERPKAGMAAPDVLHQALQAQDQLARSPRPTPPETNVAQASIGSTPADSPTKDLSIQTAATRLQSRGAKVAQAIDDAS